MESEIHVFQVTGETMMKYDEIKLDPCNKSSNQRKSKKV